MHTALLRGGVESLDDENPIRIYKTVLIKTRNWKRAYTLFDRFLVSVLIFTYFLVLFTGNGEHRLTLNFSLSYIVISCLGCYAVHKVNSYCNYIFIEILESALQRQMWIYQDSVIVKDNYGIIHKAIWEKDIDPRKDISIELMNDDTLSALIFPNTTCIGFIEIGGICKIGPFEYCNDIMPLLHRSLMKNISSPPSTSNKTMRVPYDWGYNRDSKVFYGTV